jgi:phage-related protein
VLILVAGAATQAAAALFALPAALGVLGAAIAPVMIALSGFSEAVGAGLSGDTEKFAEALKGLAPSAQKVAKELVALGPQFKSIKANVQQAFFQPLVGAFTVLGRTLIPALNQGLTKTAGAMGNLAREVLNVFSAPQNVKTFQALFASTDRIIQTLEPAVANLAQALLNLIRPALPFLERGATYFRDFAASVEGFTRRISSDGTLAGWLEKAGHILKTTTAIAKEFGKYLLTILGGKVGDNGAGFLDDVLEKLKEINAFMQTAEGQEFINNLATGVKAIGKILTFLLGTFVISIAVINGFIDGIRLLGRALEAIGRGAVDGVVWLGEFFVNLWDSITDGLSTAWTAVSRFFEGIGSAIADFFTKTIPGWFDAIVGFFRELPDRAVAAGDGLRDKLKDWAFRSSKAVLDGFLFGIGVVIGLFLALPGMIVRAVQALPGLLSDFWDMITEGATTAWNATRDAVVGAVMAIPGLLAMAGEAIWQFFVDLWNNVVELALSVPGLLADAGRAIGQFFTDLWNGVVTDSYNAVVEGVNAVIDWFASIPGKIAALGPRILEAARGIGRSIAKGLTEIGNFASDLGAKVTASLRTGINYVIDGINRGINAVDEKVPGTLPRIPKLARGAVVDSPTLALIGEAGSEVVIPLTNRARAQDLAEQSGLLSMLRGAGGAPSVTVIAYLDPSGVIIPVVRTVVDDTLDGQGSELPYARAA